MDKIKKIINSLKHKHDYKEVSYEESIGKCKVITYRCSECGHEKNIFI